MRAVSRWALVVFLMLLVSAPVFGTAAANLPTPQTHPLGLGGPPPTTGVVVIPSVALILVGYNQWSGLWQPAGNGSQTFASSFQLYLYDIGSGPQTFSIVWNISGSLAKQNVTIFPNEPASLVFSPSGIGASWTNIKFSIFGTADWHGQIAVPVSLIPLAGYNIGGLDLIVLAVLSMMLASSAGYGALAAWVMRRAKLSPQLSMLAWGHVIILSILGTVLLNYQVVDQVTAGWSPLLYPLLLGPAMFFSFLSLFNRAKRTEIIQVLARPEGKVGIRRWEVWIIELATGQLAIAKKTWGDFFARCFGHFVTISSPDPLEAQPMITDVENVRKIGFERVRDSPAEWVVMDESANSKKAISGFMVSLSSHPVKIVWPRLTWHRTIPEHSVLVDGKPVKVPARRALAWLHYTEGSASQWRLASAMYAVALAVMAEWLSAADAAEILSIVQHDLYLTKSRFQRRVTEQVEEVVSALESALGRRDKAWKTEKDLGEDEDDT